MWIGSWLVVAIESWARSSDLLDGSLVGLWKYLVWCGGELVGLGGWGKCLNALGKVAR